MKTTSVIAVFLVAAMSVFPVGCGGNKPNGDENGNGGSLGGDGNGGNGNAVIAPDYVTADADKIADFAKGEPTGLFHKANGYSNGGMFDCQWSYDNIWVQDGAMQVVVREKPTNGYKYTGGEYRTNDKYSYGYFSACMKAAKCSGVVSSLFTYTNKPRWDEIDIEFLGNDTTKVQFNYFTDGVGNHEFVYDLGYDASTEFHEYGFSWQPDCIIWYVDGKAVHKATKDIPQNAGQIMTNVWNGKGVEDWIGKFTYPGHDVVAQYKWIAYKAL